MFLINDEIKSKECVAISIEITKYIELEEARVKVKGLSDYK